MDSKILTVANGITIFRLFLFGGFVWMLFLQDLQNAILFFFGAWALDAIDGPVARILKEVSPFGSQLDKFIDRLIIGLGVLFLIRTDFLPPEALLILTKDIALLPAVTWHAMRNESVQEVGGLGKLMTFLQGGGIVWLLMGWPYFQVIVGVVGSLGAVVAFQHLKKVHRTK